MWGPHGHIPQEAGPGHWPGEGHSSSRGEDLQVGTVTRGVNRRSHCLLTCCSADFHSSWVQIPRSRRTLEQQQILPYICKSEASQHDLNPGSSPPFFLLKMTAYLFYFQQIGKNAKPYSTLKLMTVPTGNRMWDLKKKKKSNFLLFSLQNYQEPRFVSIMAFPWSKTLSFASHLFLGAERKFTNKFTPEHYSFHMSGAEIFNIRP